MKRFLLLFGALCILFAGGCDLTGSNDEDGDSPDDDQKAVVHTSPAPHA